MPPRRPSRLRHRRPGHLLRQDDGQHSRGRRRPQPVRIGHAGLRSGRADRPREVRRRAVNTAEWQEHYLRTIPACGELTMTYVFSHDYSLAPCRPGCRRRACARRPGRRQRARPRRLAPAARWPAGRGLAASPPSAHRCRVPKLRGKTLRRAKLLLRRAHCRLGAVTRRCTTKVRVAPGAAVEAARRRLARRQRPCARRAGALTGSSPQETARNVRAAARSQVCLLKQSDSKE